MSVAQQRIKSQHHSQTLPSSYYLERIYEDIKENSYSKLMDLQDELERSNQNIESLLEQSLQQFNITKFKGIELDGTRYSFASQLQLNKQEIDQEVQIQNDKQEQKLSQSDKLELTLCKERIRMLEKKIEIYESALKSMEEENFEYSKQLSQAQEYQILYNKIIENEFIRKLQKNNQNTVAQMQILTEINAILQKEIAELKVENYEPKICLQREEIKEIDKQLQCLLENEELIYELNESKKEISGLNEKIQELTNEVIRLKSINSYLHSQLEKKNQ